MSMVTYIIHIFNITNYKFSSEGFTICTSLTFDLIADQEKLPRNRRNPFTGKKGKNPSAYKY